MRTRLTEDEEAVKEVFDGFFANESPVEVVRAAEPGGHDPELWAKLAETGAPGMALPETAGGGGAALTDLAVVVESWGAHLAPVPLVRPPVGIVPKLRHVELHPFLHGREPLRSETRMPTSILSSDFAVVGQGRQRSDRVVHRRNGGGGNSPRRH